MIRSILATCILTSISIPALAMAEPGDMMHMTITLKVQVLADPTTNQVFADPVILPPRTMSNDDCMSKSHDMRIFATKSKGEKHCEVSDYKVIGNTETFHETCSSGSSGPIRMSSDASFALQPSGVHGTIHTESEVNGKKSMIVDTTFDGTATGSCDYAPPADSK